MTAVFTFPTFTSLSNLTLKQRANAFMAVGVLASVLLHLLVLSLFPAFSIADVSRDGAETQAIEVLQQVNIPPPPETLARPAIPILSAALGFDPDISIAPVDFGALPPAVPPAPVTTATGSGDARAWVPYEVAPTLRNREEYSRAIERAYPAVLRNAGVGGTVHLAIQLDETGAVMRIDVDQSSGYAQLDAVAVELAATVARFSPALNRDQPVSVWIRLPVAFQAR